MIGLCDKCHGKDYCGWDKEEYPACYDEYKGKSMYLANAFSLQMITGINMPVNLEVKEVDADFLTDIELVSAIGHADTAYLLSNILDRDIVCNRININLNRGDSIIIAQIVGGRLPEGTFILPQGVEIKFYMVTVK